MVSRLLDELVEESSADRAIRLFGGPYIQSARSRLDIPEGSKRLLVFVALRPGRTERRHVAGILWPDVDEGRAAGNLRSALWRLHKADIDVVESDKHSLATRTGAVLDIDLIKEWSHRVISGRATARDLAKVPNGTESFDLLPGWYDDWVLLERESIRQRMLHALEALSYFLIDEDRSGEAVLVSMSAVTADPLRESAHRAVICAHLAEGNLSEAHRTLESYRVLLWRELRVSPGEELTALLRSYSPAHRRVRSAETGSFAFPHAVTAR
jgi:DNA-binding SARP family transcriptional activator